MARNVAKMTAFLRPRLWMITCDTFLMDLGSVDSKRTILREGGREGRFTLNSQHSTNATRDFAISGIMSV